MAGTFVPSATPRPYADSPVIGEELSADFLLTPAKGYSINVDPTSKVLAAHTADGLLFTLAPDALVIDPTSTTNITQGPNGLKVNMGAIEADPDVFSGLGAVGSPLQLDIDPASTAIITKSPAGLKINVPPAAAQLPSTVTTFAYDALAKKLKVAVDGTTALEVDLGVLDDEATKLVLVGQNLELQSASGTVLSTTPIGQIDAQQLTGAAAAAGYTLTLSNGGAVTITAPEVGQMFPAGPSTAATELLTKDGKAVTVSALPIAPSQLTAGALPANVTVSAASLPANIASPVITTAVDSATGAVTQSINGVAQAPYTPVVPCSKILACITPGSLSGDVLNSPITNPAVTLPAAQISGVLPATALPSTTNVLAVNGANLESTVNGVLASVPMASIVPATTHVNMWSKTTGLSESVNSVASNITIAPGVIVDSLGYDAAGNPVYQPVPAPLTLTDNPTGTLTINPGTNPQQAIRPIQEQTEIGANIAAPDLFTVVDVSAGVDAHRSAYGDRVDRLVNEPMALAGASGSPGGIIPRTVTVGGRVVPTDSYQDFNGAWHATIVLPEPTYPGQTFIYQHFAGFDTTVATTNTNRTSPMVVTQAMGGAEYVALPNEIAPNLRWALRTEAPAAALPSGTATVSATGLLSMGGQTIQLIKPVSSLGTPLNYWVFPA